MSLELRTETRIAWLAGEGERWTVPILATVSKVDTIQRQRVNVLLGVRRYVVAPTGGPDWGMRAAVAFLLPVQRPGDPQAAEPSTGS